MSSMSNVAGLSKWIRTLPNAKSSLLMIIILSFITGVILFLLHQVSVGSGLEDFFYGGAFGFVVFGLPAMLTGSTDQLWVDSLNGINLKAKHSMFLALVSMSLAGLVSIIGTGVGYVLNMDLFFNSILFGCVIAFGFNILVILATTRIKLFNSFLIAIIQPLVMIGMLIITSFLNNIEDIYALGYISTFFKVIIASVIFLIAIYAFISVVESPMKKNLGFGAMEILSYFILHMNEGTNTIEQLFDNAGEAIDTLVGVASFRRFDGSIKALFISPCVHPGPLGNIGGSNMPTLLANSFDAFTMVAHGPSTHDFNPVSSDEIVKIEDSVRKALDSMEYSSKASEFIRYSHEKANVGVQFFKNGTIMLSTFAPSGSDDIEYAVGFAAMIESQKQLGTENNILVDCHNSFNEEKGGVLPGNPELFQLLDTIKLINPKDLEHDIKVGCYYTDLLFDSNNMELGYRETIFNAVKDLDIDEIEVMTTDTHTVNTLSAGYNPVGTVEKEKIIEFVKLSINEAIKDLEPVEAGTNTERILNLKTFGPNNSTELISTISSIVAVSKIIAPLTFIVAIIFVIIWIFVL
nr:DUF2070 family protein [uncultured Methanobrevibacter sp.]